MAAIKTGAAQKSPVRLPSNLGARLGWQARRLWRRGGWTAAAGLAALALALLAQQQSQGLLARQRLVAGELAAAVRLAALPAPALPDEADGMAAFYAYLPAHDAIPERLKDLVEVAQKSGVTLIKAEYKPQQENNAAFLRYQITLPVKAEYANIQTFLVNALQALPTLTLESVIFKREQIESAEVEARIQFVLLVKKEPRR
ncbi:MAG TPA: hypothetical protein DCW29_14575 [Janthinobacterium sp.]|nr:hypothetical protein [Janthinobacterium sp.]